MKTIIAGSRHITHYPLLLEALSICPFTGEITEVVSGGAKGVDSLGEQWAQSQQMPVKQFPADWDAHGKSAGPIRNRQMADYADALILVWDGKSWGSMNMLHEAKKRGLRVFLHFVSP